MTSSRSPSALCLMIGATWRGNIAGSGSKAAMRLSDSPNLRASAPRLVRTEYRLHTDDALFPPHASGPVNTHCHYHWPYARTRLDSSHPQDATETIGEYQNVGGLSSRPHGQAAGTVETVHAEKAMQKAVEEFGIKPQDVQRTLVRKTV